MGIFTKEIWLEFSTSKIKIIRQGKLSIKERAIIAIDDNQKVLAVGNSVDEKIHKKTITPINGGIVEDFQAFEYLLRDLIKKTLKNESKFFTPSLISHCIIPDTCTEVEKRGILDSLEHVNSKEVILINSSFALSKGIELDKNDTYMIIDAGEEKISFSIIAKDNIKISSKLNFGSKKIKELIRFTIKDHYEVKCELSTVEDILHNYIAYDDKPNLTKHSVTGKDNYGARKTVEIDISLLNNVVRDYLNIISYEVEILVDRYNNMFSERLNYIVITGGLAKLRGLKNGLEKETNYTVIDKSDSDYILKGLIKMNNNFMKNLNFE